MYEKSKFFFKFFEKLIYYTNSPLAQESSQVESVIGANELKS